MRANAAKLAQNQKEKMHALSPYRLSHQLSKHNFEKEKNFNCSETLYLIRYKKLVTFLYKTLKYKNN